MPSSQASLLAEAQRHVADLTDEVGELKSELELRDRAIHKLISDVDVHKLREGASLRLVDALRQHANQLERRVNEVGSPADALRTPAALRVQELAAELERLNVHIDALGSDQLDPAIESPQVLAAQVGFLKESLRRAEHEASVARMRAGEAESQLQFANSRAQSEELMRKSMLDQKVMAHAVSRHHDFLQTSLASAEVKLSDLETSLSETQRAERSHRERSMQLEARIKLLEGEVADQKATIDRASSNAARAKAEHAADVERLQNELQRALSDLTVQKQAASQLRDQLRDVLQSKDTLEHTMSMSARELRGKLSASQSDLERCQSECERLATRADEMSERAERADEALTAARRERAAEKASLESLVDDLRSQLGLVQAKSERLESQLREQTALEEGNAARLDQSRRSRVQLEESLRSTESRLAQQQLAAETQQSMLEQLRADFEQLESRHKSLLDQKHAAEEQASAARAQLAQQQLVAQQVERDRADVAARLERAQAELERAHETCSRLESDARKASEQHTQLLRDLERARADLSAARRTSAELEARLSEAQGALRDRADALASAKQAHDVLSLEIETLRAQRTLTLDDAQHGVAAQLAQLKQDLMSRIREIGTLEKRCSELEGQAAEAKSAADFARQSLADKVNLVETLQERVAALLSDSEQQEQRVRDLAGQNERLQTELAKTRAAKQELEEWRKGVEALHSRSSEDRAQIHSALVAMQSRVEALAERENTLRSALQEAHDAVVEREAELKRVRAQLATANKQRPRDAASADSAPSSARGSDADHQDMGDRLNALSDQLEALSQETIRLRDREGAHESELRERDDAVQQLQEAVESARAEAEELRGIASQFETQAMSALEKLKAQQQQNRQMAEIIERQQALIENSPSATDVRDEINKVSSSLQESREQQAQLLAENEKLSEIVQQLQTLLEQAMLTLKERNQENQDLQQRLGELQELVEKSEEAKDAAMEQSSLLQQLNERVTTALEAAQERMGNIEESYKRAAGEEIQRLKTALEQRSAELKRARAQNAEFAEQLRLIEQQMDVLRPQVAATPGAVATDLNGSGSATDDDDDDVDDGSRSAAARAPGTPTASWKQQAQFFRLESEGLRKKLAAAERALKDRESHVERIKGMYAESSDRQLAASRSALEASEKAVEDQRREHQALVDALEQKLAASRQEMFEFETRMFQVKETHRNHLQRVEQDLLRCRQETQQSGIAAKLLESENTSLTRRVSQLESENADISARLSRIRSEHATLGAQHTALVEQLQEIGSTLLDMQVAEEESSAPDPELICATARSEIVRLRALTRESTAQLDEMQASLRASSSRALPVKALEDLEKLRKMNMQLRDDLTEVIGERDALRERIDQLEGERETLRSELNLSLGDLRESEATNEANEQREKLAQEVLYDAIEEASTLRQNSAGLRSSLEAAAAENAELRQEVVELRASQRQSDAETARALRTSTDSVRAERDHCRRQLEDALQELELARQQLEELRDVQVERDRLEAELERLTDAVDQARTHGVSTESRLSASGAQVRSLETDVGGLRAVVVELESELEKVRHDLRRERAVRSDLEGRVKELKTERDDAVSSAEATSDELDELRRESASRDAEYERLLRTERERHEEALQTVKHEGDVVVRMVKAEQKEAVDSLTRRMNRLLEEQRQSQEDDFERRVAALKREHEESIQAHAVEIEVIRDEHTEAMQAVQTQISSMESEMTQLADQLETLASRCEETEQAKEAMEAELTAEIEREREAKADEIERLRKEHAAALARAASAKDDAVREARIAAEDDIREARAAFERETSELRERASFAMVDAKSALQGSHEAELRKLKEQYTAACDERVRTLMADHAAVIAARDTLLQAAKAQFEDEMALLKRSHDASVASMREQHDSTVAALKQRSADQAEASKAAADAEVQRLVEQLQRARQQHLEELEAMRAAHSRRFEQQSASHAADMESERRRAQARLDDVQQQLKAKIDSLQAAQAQDVAALHDTYRRQMDTMRAEHEGAIERALHDKDRSLDERVRSLQQQLADLRATHRQHVDSLQTEVVALRDKCMRLEETTDGSNEEMQLVRTELDERTQRLRDYEAETERLRAAEVALTARLEQFEAENDNLRSSVANFERAHNELTSLRQSHTSLSERSVLLEQRHTDLEQAHAQVSGDLERQVKQLRATNDDLLRKFEVQKGELREATSLLESTSADLVAARRRVQELEHTEATLESGLRFKKDELGRESERLASVELERSTLEERCRAAEAELRTARARIEQLQAQVEGARREAEAHEARLRASHEQALASLEDDAARRARDTLAKHEADLAYRDRQAEELRAQHALEKQRLAESHEAALAMLREQNEQHASSKSTELQRIEAYYKSLLQQKTEMHAENVRSAEEQHRQALESREAHFKLLLENAQARIVAMEERLRASIADKDAQCEQLLQAQVLESKRTLEETEAHRDRLLQSRTEQFESKLASQRQALEEAHRERDEAHAKEMAELQAELRDKRARLDDATAQLARSESQLRERSAALDEANEQLATLTSKLHEEAQKAKHDARRVAALTTELESTRRRVTDLDDTVARLEEQLRAAERAKESASRSAREAESRATSALEQLEAVRADLDRERAEVGSLRDGVRADRVRRPELEEHLQTLAADYQRLERALADAEAQRDALSRTMDELRGAPAQQMDQLRDELESTRQELTQCHADRASLQALLETARGIARELEDDLSSQRAEFQASNRALAEENAELKRTFAEVREEHRSLQERFARLTDLLQQAEAANSEIEREREQLRDELREQQQLTESQEEALMHARTRITTMQAEQEGAHRDSGRVNELLKRASLAEEQVAAKAAELLATEKKLIAARQAIDRTVLERDAVLDEIEELAQSSSAQSIDVDALHEHIEAFVREHANQRFGQYHRRQIDLERQVRESRQLLVDIGVDLAATQQAVSDMRNEAAAGAGGALAQQLQELMSDVARELPVLHLDDKYESATELGWIHDVATLAARYLDESIEAASHSPDRSALHNM